MASVEAIAKALGGHKAGGGWMARCPAHDDREPSLSIRKADALDKARRELVARIWHQTGPASGSLIGRYLATRGIVSPLPSDLHIHPHLRHPTGAYAPAMVAAVRNVDGDVTGLHRTWLRDDGACKARLSPAKSMLGICRGGAVWLADVDDELGVSEGIESGLSVQQATGLPVWAALSTSGLIGLVMPARVRRIVILADGDEPGEKAAQMAAAARGGSGVSSGPEGCSETIQ